MMPRESEHSILDPADVIGAADERPWVQTETPPPNLSGLLVAVAFLVVFAAAVLIGMWAVVSIIEFAGRFAR